METPLPTDIVERIRQDFGTRSEAVIGIFDELRRAKSTFIHDRIVRCVIFLAGGDDMRLLDQIDLWRQDYRDVISAAEYDSLHVLQLRDFNQPFGSAEIA